MVEVVKVWSEMLSFAETEVKDAVAEVESVAEAVVTDVEAVVDSAAATVEQVAEFSEEIPPAAPPASGPPDIDPA